MEQVQLTADIRKGTKKSDLRSLRQAGRVPAVFYGKNIENRLISVDARELNKILSTYGSNVLINLKIGDESHTTMLREVQKDFIKGDVLHVDFFKVSLKDKIETTVPLVLKGDAEGVRKGGVLQHQMRELTIKALPTEIPEHIDVDVSELDIGEFFTVSDLIVPGGIEVLNDGNEIIATVVAPKIEQEAEAPEEEEAAEPELVREKEEKAE
ncbi:MAG: large subunit ribosomal protein [Thermosediminibacterales bacterium]|nr:large subunit ribosomal protein [Thermosediminibacterales bacterium]